MAFTSSKAPPPEQTEERLDMNYRESSYELRKISLSIVSELRRGRWECGILYHEMIQDIEYSHIEIGDIFRLSKAMDAKKRIKRAATRWLGEKLHISLMPEETKQDSEERELGGMQQEERTPTPKSHRYTMYRCR